MSIETHRNLLAWRKAIVLATRIHELTAGFTGHDRQTLSLAMRHCAVSIASAIAQGAALRNRPDHIRLLQGARGRLFELEAQLCVCAALGLLGMDARLEEDVAELSRLLTAMVHRLREHREQGRGF